MKQIIAAPPGCFRVLFLLLAGTGMRIGEALALHPREDLDLDHGIIYVRRSVWRGHEQTPKTENAVRQIDIDPALAEALRAYIGDSERSLLFETCNGTPLSDVNIRNRVLTPLLKQLNIPRAGLHAFRHSRVTMLRKYGDGRRLAEAVDRSLEPEDHRPVLAHGRGAGIPSCGSREGGNSVVNGPKWPSWTQIRGPTPRRSATLSSAI